MQKIKSGTNPDKQRKRLFNAPAHIRHKLMAAPLSRELAASRGVKTLPVRKGDTVRIERGDNKGFEGKVSRIDLKAYRIYMEGLTREKVDGTNIFIAVHPSKVQIRNLNLDDNWRKNILSRRKASETPEAKAKAKAKAKAVKKAPAKAPAKTEEEKEIEEAFEEEASPETAEEEAPAETATEPETKEPAAKKAPAKKTAAKKEAEAKPSAKRKTTPKTEGGQ
jgi:large subunit ribosomal protein L24